MLIQPIEKIKINILRLFTELTIYGKQKKV